MKVKNKKSQGSREAVVVIEEEGEEEAVVSSGSEGFAFSEVKPPVTVEALPVPVPVAQASIRPSTGGYVRVVMLENISPGPTVGNWETSRELGVNRLEKGKTYQVPQHVYEVLCDAKKAVLIEV